MAMCKKDNRSSHQNSIKFHIFIANRAVGFSLDICCLGKALFKRFITEHIPDVRTIIS